VFRKIKNIITGNNWNWNVKHNEEAVSKIYEDFSNLNPDEKEKATVILASCTVILSKIFGPNRLKLTTDKITDKQMRQISPNQHYGMIVYCFEMFVRMFGLSNNYKHLTNIYRKSFGQYFVGIESFENNKDGLKKLVNEYSNQIAETSKVIIPNDPVFFYSFFNLATECATRLKDDLLKNKNVG